MSNVGVVLACKEYHLVKEEYKSSSPFVFARTTQLSKPDDID